MHEEDVEFFRRCYSTIILSGRSESAQCGAVIGIANTLHFQTSYIVCCKLRCKLVEDSKPLLRLARDLR
jgi:hypothetical protein